MRRRLGLALITSCALVLWSGTALAQQYPPEDPEASVTLDASSYAPGDTVSGVGEGCLSSEEVEVWLLSTPQLMTVVDADGEGAVQFSFQLPTDTSPGEHRVQLVCQVVITSAPFTVTAVPDAAGALPATGQTSFPLAWVALAALAFGTAVVVALRRRTLARAAVDR